MPLPLTCKSEPAVLVPAHRLSADTYLANVLGTPGVNVLWLTIMSHHTTHWLSGRLEQQAVRAKSVRVLTFSPEVAEKVLQAFALHLDEPLERVLKFVAEAWKTWSRFSQQYPQISVRAYGSSPTMQGVFVCGQEAMVELMSYHTGPTERVGCSYQASPHLKPLPC
jgi:hypothetical protein